MERRMSETMARNCGRVVSSAGDGERAVERDAGVQQRGEFLREEENVAAAVGAERRHFQFERPISFLFAPT
jgi:hypothetical protein